MPAAPSAGFWLPQLLRPELLSHFPPLGPREIIPAITHVDGSARYQVLRERDNPSLFKLIRAFERITGIPMLLNTSFNRAGEPLVETPVDAARCVVNSTADYLVVNRTPYRNAATGGLWNSDAAALAADSRREHSGK